MGDGYDDMDAGERVARADARLSPSPTAGPPAIGEERTHAMRTGTDVIVRLNPAHLDRLYAQASKRAVSRDFLINAAVEELLDHLDVCEDPKHCTLGDPLGVAP
jgi:hypothetical protein